MIDADIESELRAMLVAMDSAWGARRSVGRDYSSLAAETNWKRGFKEGWLAAKRDAAIPEDAIAVLVNHCIDDPQHGNVPEIMQWLKANDPEAYRVIESRNLEAK